MPLPPQHWDYENITQYFAFVPCALGIELMPLCLQGKPFAGWANSPVPCISLFNVHCQMQRVPLQWHSYSLCHFIYAASVKAIYIIQWLNLKLILWVSSWASHRSSLWLLQPVLFSLSANQKGYLTFKLYPAGKRDLLIVIFSKVIWNEEIKGRNVTGGSRKQDPFVHSTVIHTPAQKASKIHFLCIAKDGDRNEPQRTVLINKDRITSPVLRYLAGRIRTTCFKSSATAPCEV